MIPVCIIPVLTYITIASATVIPEDSVRFLFYNSTIGLVELKTEDLSNNHGLFVNKPLKVICHGLATSSSINWYKNMIEAYSRIGYNVVAVDWAFFAFRGYVKAIAVCQEIAVLIGEYITRLSEALNIKLKDVHVIGHSLGGHIVGFSGKYIFKKCSEKLGRITGLDPAGPLYNHLSEEERLSREDADFVDVIHTNAGVLGIKPSVGHMDFYPDGGVFQTRCGSNEIECSHNVAVEYFIRSIGNDIFNATLCESYSNYTLGYCNDGVKSVMGDGCVFSVGGDYFLTVDSE